MNGMPVLYLYAMAASVGIFAIRRMAAILRDAADY